MNELKNIWEAINKKVNVFLLLSLVLILFNIFLVSMLLEVVQADTSLSFSSVSRRLTVQNEEPDYIIDENYEEILLTVLPRKYKILSEVNIFAPPTLLKKEATVAKIEEMQRIIDEDAQNDEADAIVYQRPKQLPFITGYSVDGIIVDDRSNGIAIIHEQSTGKNYVVKENTFIQGTNIRVLAISQGQVLLSQRGRQDTVLTLKKSTMFQYWLDAEPELFNK